MTERQLNRLIYIFTIICISVFSIGCSAPKQATKDPEGFVKLTDKISTLDSGLYAMEYEGDIGFDQFLKDGGAVSEKKLLKYIKETLSNEISDLNVEAGCSTISGISENGDAFLGRNFDFEACNGLILVYTPEHGYKSISTVNLDFFNTKSTDYATILKKVGDSVFARIALYGPLDGMNEKGFCIAVHTVQGIDGAEQNTDKPDLTITTLARLLLNQSASVDEAISILKDYDVHLAPTKKNTVHYTLSDASGKNVVVEYIDNELTVTETPVVTNFILTEGPYYGIGSEQSQERYDILMDITNKNSSLNEEDITSALEKVKKSDFSYGYSSSEWSIVYNKTSGTARYFHRENFDTSYLFDIKQ